MAATDHALEFSVMRLDEVVWRFDVRYATVLRRQVLCGSRAALRYDPSSSAVIEGRIVVRRLQADSSEQAFPSLADSHVSPAYTPQVCAVRLDIGGPVCVSGSRCSLRGREARPSNDLLPSDAWAGRDKGVCGAGTLGSFPVRANPHRASAPRERSGEGGHYPIWSITIFRNSSRVSRLD